MTDQPREGEQYLPGEFGSKFDQNKLSFRRLLHDDDFCNVFGFLCPWLASISETSGFVGYFRGDFDTFPTLVYFEDGKASVCEMRPIKFFQSECVDSSDAEKPLLCLEFNSMTNIVKQELLRQAENSKMPLEEYIASTGYCRLIYSLD